MRKILMLLIFSVLSITLCKAQMVVSDPTMLEVTISNWSLQLEEAKKQFTEIQEQTKFLQESINQYKKVNQYVKNASAVKNLIDKQVQTISLLSSEINRAGSDVTNVKAYDSYISRLKRLLSQSQSNVTTLTELLSDDILNLTDFERMQLVNELDSKTSSLLGSAKAEKKKYDTLNNNLKRVNKIVND